MEACDGAYRNHANDTVSRLTLKLSCKRSTQYAAHPLLALASRQALNRNASDDLALVGCSASLARRS